MPHSHHQTSSLYSSALQFNVPVYTAIWRCKCPSVIGTANCQASGMFPCCSFVAFSTTIARVDLQGGTQQVPGWIMSHKKLRTCGDGDLEGDAMICDSDLEGERGWLM